MDLLITRLDYLVTGDGVLTNHDIVVRDGRILAIKPSTAGPAAIAPTTDSSAGAPVDEDANLPGRRIDGRGFCAIAGFKNAHTHAAMTLLRGYGDDMRLQEWLETRIWPAEAALTGDDVYWGTRLAAIEMVRSGTTFANDMYFYFPEAWRAVVDSGIRGAVGLALFDFGDSDRLRELQGEVDTLLERYSGERGLVFPTLAPHSIYTCSDELLRWSARRAAEMKLPYHIHMSETQREVDECIARTGVRPWRHLERIGVLAEIAGRGIAAHAIWLDDDELALISEYGITLAHNPASNMKLASGAFDWSAARERGIPVMLAPDGVASNNNLDMFDEMRLAALLQKHHYADPTRLTAEEILAAATGEYSAVFAAHGVGGALSVGAPADIALLRLDDPQMTPVHNIRSNLVYAANGSIVDTVICNGKVLMEGRIVPEQENVLRHARERATALRDRVGSSAQG